MSELIASPAQTVRRNAGVTLQQISERTKISVRNLEAIESGDFKKLPGGIYTTSYIRQYAREIGFDEFELLEHYHRVTGEPPAAARIDRGPDPSSPTFRPLFQY
jgi:cytoskeletal protein RodZ